MARPEVEEFARLLVAHVRDMAIGDLDVSLRATATGACAKRWRQTAQTGRPGELAAEMVPDCVDGALFYLLDAIDQGLLKLSFTSESGKTVDLADLGDSEMSGEYMASWRSAYSKERVNDDFADLL